MNKPKDNKFWQQHLPGCFLIMTPKKVITSFLVMGIVFFLVGIVLFITNSLLFNVTIKYDINDGPSTTKTFDVSKTIKAPIFIHYSIHAFYQNHRKFVNNANNHSEGYIFNDTVELLDSKGRIIDIDQTDLLTVYDKKRKDLSIYNDQQMAVWMKIATLPTFKKLYGIVQQDMESGKYTLLINNSYLLPNHSRKEFCIETTNGAGGPNYYLPIIYTATGAVITGLGLIFILIELLCGRKLGKKHAKFQIAIPKRFRVAEKIQEKEQAYEQGTLKRTPKAEKLASEQQDIPLHLLTTEDCAKYYKEREQSSSLKNAVKVQRKEREAIKTDEIIQEQQKEQKKTRSHIQQFRENEDNQSPIKKVQSLDALEKKKKEKRQTEKKKEDDQSQMHSARQTREVNHTSDDSELTLEMIMPKVDNDEQVDGEEDQYQHQSEQRKKETKQ